MKLHPLIKLRSTPTKQIIELLSEAVLGTNGAKYRHLDVPQKIEEIDHPLYLSLERNTEKTISNITFCRRSEHWYIRYFAFDKIFQSTGKKGSSAKKTNLLRSELDKFFAHIMDEKSEENVSSLYAYIDPNNQKSLWMSENFHFKTKAKIATQTYSRVKPKTTTRIQKLTEWKEIEDIIITEFSSYNYFFLDQVSKPPFYIVRDENNEIIAGCKLTHARWEIERLPGILGGILPKAIPFIPLLNRIVRPKNHTFVVPEAVFVKENNATLLNELFEGILYSEKEHLLIWWVDNKDPLYKTCKATIKWGILDSLVGVNQANLVVKTRAKSQDLFNENLPAYISGIDFI